MLQPLRVILAAETAARERLEAARQEAARVVAEAEAEAARTIDESRRQFDELARMAEHVLVEAAEGKAADVGRAAETQIEALRALAEVRMESAASLVVQCLLPSAVAPGKAQ